MRNVPDELGAALDELAGAESMSVNAYAVRALSDAVAFRRNASVLRGAADLGVELDDIVEAVREGRTR